MAEDKKSSDQPLITDRDKQIFEEGIRFSNLVGLINTMLGDIRKKLRKNPSEAHKKEVLSMYNNRSNLHEVYLEGLSFAKKYDKVDDFQGMTRRYTMYFPEKVEQLGAV